MVLSNKAYDILKWIVLVVLPAFGTLYSSLAFIWGFPFSSEVTSSVCAICTFLGVCLGISSINYKGVHSLD